jgi:hypothetical protein
MCGSFAVRLPRRECSHRSSRLEELDAFEPVAEYWPSDDEDEEEEEEARRT